MLLSCPPPQALRPHESVNCARFGRPSALCVRAGSSKALLPDQTADFLASPRTRKVFDGSQPLRQELEEDRGCVVAGVCLQHSMHACIPGQWCTNGFIMMGNEGCCPFCHA
eukprot:scaffold48027_cov14-Tisochrysis_lutea.AAC.1